VSGALLIRDGQPWWMSPDIWVVPGPDPYGTPAIPAVGESSFVWGRVENRSETDLENIQVNFYWSNPATGVLRSNSTLIGSAFASIPAGDTREVLCLTPWAPAGVNNGHECLIAEAVHPADPLPNPLPDPFAPPTYDQVAQRNIDLLMMRMKMMRAVGIQIAAPLRTERTAVITLRREFKPLPDEIARTIGLGKREFDPEMRIFATLSDRPDLSCDTGEEIKELTLKLTGGKAQTVFLQLRNEAKHQGAYCWFSVIEHDARTKDEIGGVSFVVTGDEEG